MTITIPNHVTATLRGARIRITPPHVQYAHFCQLSFDLEDGAVGDTELRIQQATSTCSESRQLWRGNSRVEADVRLGTWDERGWSHPEGRRGILTYVFGGRTILWLDEDADAAALAAEIDAITSAWLGESVAGIEKQKETTKAVAQAVALESLPSSPWGEAVECLECGAVYAAPESVERGAMDCRRCA